MGWVKKKKCNIKLKFLFKNKMFFEFILCVENWFKINIYIIKIVKWEIKVWGEIFVDFGRK